MSVTKLANGKWEARCRDHAGRERCATKRTKAEAVKWERDFLQARDQGTLLDSRGSKTTFKDYAEQWRSIQDHRPKTRRSIGQILTLLAYPTFEARRLSTIRPPEIKTWYAKLPLSTGYKKLCYRWVASIFKAAVQDRYIAVSPCQLSLPTKDKSKPPLEALTVAHVNYAAEHVSPRYGAAIIFAAGTGLRPSEWCGLTVDRVDFLRGVVTVERQLEGVTKDGHPIFCPPKSAAGYRKVPIAQCIVDALAAHLALYGPGIDGLLFSSAAKRPIQASALGKWWHKAVDGHLPEWATPNDLRHFYASMLIHQGCSIKQVQRAMGHESATITLDTYAAWWPNSDDELRDAVQTILGADGTQAESEHDEPSALPNGTPSRQPDDAQRPEVG